MVLIRIADSWWAIMGKQAMCEKISILNFSRLWNLR